MESLCRGLSGMDAARAAMGQGWPFAAGPWNDDETREPDEVGPDARGKTSWLLLGRLPEVTRRKGGTIIGNVAKAASSCRTCRPTTARLNEKSVGYAPRSILRPRRP